MRKNFQLKDITNYVGCRSDNCYNDKHKYGTRRIALKWCKDVTPQKFMEVSMNIKAQCDAMGKKLLDVDYRSLVTTNSKFCHLLFYIKD